MIRRSSDLLAELVGITVAPHAWRAMRRRDVDAETLGELLADPELVEPAGVTRSGLPARRFVRDGLAAVVASSPSGPVVLTVLLRRGSRWTDLDAATR